jgi:hypothetical protein
MHGQKFPTMKSLNRPKAVFIEPFFCATLKPRSARQAGLFQQAHHGGRARLATMSTARRCTWGMPGAPA